MDLLEVGNLGAELATMEHSVENQRGGGEAETESLISWFVVLQLLADGWWWSEAHLESYSGFAGNTYCVWL